jgi:hypothetical protein
MPTLWETLPDPDDDPLATPPTIHARRTDPATSAAGAASVTLRSGTHKALLLLAYAEAPGPIADVEAAERTGLLHRPGACWWKRSSELRHLDMIYPAATTRSPITGEDVLACSVTALGATTAARLAENGLRLPAGTDRRDRSTWARLWDRIDHLERACPMPGCDFYGETRTGLIRHLGRTHGAR